MPCYISSVHILPNPTQRRVQKQQKITPTHYSPIATHSTIHDCPHLVSLNGFMSLHELPSYRAEKDCHGVLNSNGAQWVYTLCVMHVAPCLIIVRIGAPPIGIGVNIFLIFGWDMVSQYTLT